MNASAAPSTSNYERDTVRIRHLQDIMNKVLHTREMAGQSHSLHKK